MDAEGAASSARAGEGKGRVAVSYLLQLFLLQCRLLYCVLCLLQWKMMPDKGGHQLQFSVS